MKKISIIMLLAILSATFIVTSSCKKKPKDPDYPQLVGTWNGTTSQEYSVKLYVDNFDGELRLTYAFIVYSNGPGNIDTLIHSNSDGLATLSGKYVKYYFDNTTATETNIDATFTTDSLTVSGTFKAANPDNPSNPLIVTYTGIKQ